MAGAIPAIADVERVLRERAVPCSRERFRLPSLPRVSPAAGFLLCAAACFLLVAGHAAASFLLASAGAVLLLLDARGFSPLDWLGPREMRSVLVVPGTPSDGTDKALVFAVPLRCRLTSEGCLARAEAIRGALRAAGVVLSFSLCALSGAVILVFLSPPVAPAAAAGVAMLALAALERFPRAPAEGPPNLAAGWADRLVEPTRGGRRPFLLVYSGDEGEVKYFLARYRGPLFRGNVVFLEFAPGAEGPPGMSGREGPLVPCRVDERLRARAAEAARTAGIPGPGVRPIRCRSAGLVAMSRGFRAITLFREEGPPGGREAYPETAALAWARAVACGGPAPAPGPAN